MVEWWYWALLIGLMTVGIAFRLRLGRPLADWVRLTGVESVLGALAVAALVAHCVAMFLPALVPEIGALPSAAEAIRELGPISQVAYWAPAIVMLMVLRRLPWPALTTLAGGLLAVGATMFWPFPLTVHLAAIAGTVAILAGVVTMTVTPLSGSPGGDRGTTPIR